MCATEYSLAKYCGVTFARIKPASLFTITQENSSHKKILINCGFCQGNSDRRDLFLC